MSKTRTALTFAALCAYSVGLAALAAAEDAPTTGKAKPGASKAAGEDSEKRDRNSPQKGNRARNNAQVAPDAIPGYTIKQIQGFNVIIHDSVLSQDTAKFERKPLEVLELELSTIVGLMPPNATDVLRRLLIWVEWDEETDLSNGRNGKAAAVYYGGHQLQLLKGGKHPLKAKSVTVLSMLELTKEHQPDRDSGRCVLLHEMAHAVHNELLGRDAEPVRAAYYQAMQRNLYEKHLYAATNEQEFFAETTCAYFDQLHYYPKTREDLEKHDPVTFRLMQEVWGKRPMPKTALAKNASSAAAASSSPGDESPKPAIKLADLDLGKTVSGREFTPSQLEGRAVMLVLWNEGNGSSLSCLSKLQTWNDELGNYGLVTIAQHLTGQQAANVEELAKFRKVSFTVTEGRWTDKSLVKKFTDFPLCLVFDHTGQCVYQGSPFDAEPTLRSAVGAAIVASVDGEEMPKTLTAMVEAIRKGTPPQSQLARLSALARSKTAPGHELAATLLERLSENGRNELNAARELLKDEPVTAFLTAERVAAAYKGSPLAQEAAQMAGKLRSLKPVQQEIQARKVLELVKRIDTELSSRPGGFDPKQDSFQMRNAKLIQELKNAVSQVVKIGATTRAAEEALAIAGKYSAS